MAKAKERVLVDVDPEIAQRFDTLCKALDKPSRVAGFIALIEIAEETLKHVISRSQSGPHAAKEEK